MIVRHYIKSLLQEECDFNSEVRMLYINDKIIHIKVTFRLNMTLYIEVRMVYNNDKIIYITFTFRLNMTLYTEVRMLYF